MVKNGECDWCKEKTEIQVVDGVKDKLCYLCYKALLDELEVMEREEIEDYENKNIQRV